MQNTQTHTPSILEKFGDETTLWTLFYFNFQFNEEIKHSLLMDFHAKNLINTTSFTVIL